MMSIERKASYILFGIAAALIIWFQLGAALLAGLISLLILESAKKISINKFGNTSSKLIALFSFLIISAIFFWILAVFVHLAAIRAPMIVSLFIPKIKSLADQWGVSLPFDNLDDIRGLIASSAKDNLRQITHASSLLTKGFLQIVLAIFAAVACFWEEENKKRSEAGFSERLREEMAARMKLFMKGFQKAFGAQFTISLINTGLVSFLLLILGIPYIRFLITATFVLGLLPVIGGAVTNAAILAAAFTVSTRTSILTLISLLVLHHAQYPIQGQVFGEQMKVPAWEILVGLILGEAILGVAGMVLAPAAVFYLHSEFELL